MLFKAITYWYLCNSCNSNGKNIFSVNFSFFSKVFLIFFKVIDLQIFVKFEWSWCFVICQKIKCNLQRLSYSQAIPVILMGKIFSVYCTFSKKGIFDIFLKVLTYKYSWSLSDHDASSSVRKLNALKIFLDMKRRVHSFCPK